MFFIHSDLFVISELLKPNFIASQKFILMDSAGRDEFNMKLTLLSNQWQGVVRRAQQRRGIIDGLIRQWQRYREMVEKLHKWLLEVSHPAEVLQSGNTIPLQQARSMLDAVQVPNNNNNNN